MISSFIAWKVECSSWKKIMSQVISNYSISCPCYRKIVSLTLRLMKVTSKHEVSGVLPCCCMTCLWAVATPLNICSPNTNSLLKENKRWDYSQIWCHQAMIYWATSGKSCIEFRKKKTNKKKPLQFLICSFCWHLHFYGWQCTGQ